jgi:hypothetical protein
MAAGNHPVKFTPRGMRWPWYPWFEFTAELRPPEMGADGKHVAVMVTTSAVTRRRVGVRRWVAHHARKFSTKSNNPRSTTNDPTA